MDYKTISKIYLASKSPRRRELLTQMGINYDLLEFDIPEVVRGGEDHFAYSTRICREKSEAAWSILLDKKLPLYPVLTADTEVVYNGEVLGKPIDYADAFRMWRMFAGDRHLVLTTVTLKFHEFERTVTSQSWVYFDSMTDDEIHSYLACGDYKDKSGAYGIKSYAGQFIRKIDGCFYSIMGLPLNVVKNLLHELVEHVG